LKPHTKKVLDDSTNYLDQFGFKKKRRGLTLRGNDDPDLIEAISFQPREWGDGSVFIYVFVQVIWQRLEEISARGWHLEYKLGDSFSCSRMLTDLGRPFEFRQYGNDNAEFEALKGLIDKIALPRVKAIATKSNVCECMEKEVLDGAGYPEKLVVAELLLHGQAMAEDKYASFIATTADEFLKERVRKFWLSMTSFIK
jgi:hypothetical protein